jgi:hypothetical protein
MAGVAYWVVRHSSQHPDLLARVPLFFLAGNVAYSLFNILAYVFPSLTVYLWFLNSSMDLALYGADEAGQPWYNQRLVGMKTLGLGLVYVLCAYYPPRTLFNPLRWRSYLFMGALLCIALTGFRGEVLLGMTAILLSAWFHSGWREMVLGMLAGAVFFGIVCFGQGRLYDLPYPMQRALAWLPGRWSPQAVEEGRVSTASRIDWWKSVLREGEIRNPIFGDGIGVSKADFFWMARAGSAREAFSLTGGYHSGPLSTLKHFGVVGLILLYALMIAAAVYSVRAVRRLRGTKFQPLAILTAATLVWSPVHFTFIFGDDIPQLVNLAFFGVLVRVLLEIADRMAAAPPAGAVSSP